MSLDEKIHQYTQKFPLSFQEDLFASVQYLLMRAEQQENQDWAFLSLSSAMRDMEDEPSLYSISDIRVRLHEKSRAGCSLSISSNRS